MMFGHDDNHHHDNSGPVADDQLTHDDNTTTALPLSDHDMSAAPAPSSPAVSDDTNAGYIMPDVPEPSNDAPATPLENASDVSSDELLRIKQQAVEQLSPLVGRLGQKPEDQFQTIMMLIRAVDNEKFIPQAFEAAQAISDEKERAQALLDIVNEINYFNHLKDEKDDQAA